ncbi:MAG: hypothetical protein AB1704_20110 [Pseudomonadota bacterium]
MSTVSQQVGQAIFDPTREDSASAALPAYQSEPEFVFNDMSGVDMTPGEIRSIISTDFSDCQLPAESIQTLVNSSRQVQNSLRNITKEHVAIGGHLANIAHVFLSAATEQYGDNAAVQQRALGLLWSYVERVHKMRSKSARNYIKAYRLMQNNPVAQACLTHSDAEFLSRKNLPKEVVDAVINAKSVALAAGETMTHKELKALTEELMRSRALLSDAMVTTEDLREQLADAADQLSNEKIDNQHLHEDNTRLQSEIRTMQELTTHTSEDLKRQVAHVNALRSDNDNLTSERDRLDAELKKALANPKVEYRDKDVPSQQEEQLTEQLQSLNAKIDEKRRELDAATSTLQKASDLVDAKQKKNQIDGKIAEVVDQFSTFHATYTSIQLLIAGGGYLKEYRPSLLAIADKMRQFLSEVDAAIARATA